MLTPPTYFQGSRPLTLMIYAPVDGDVKPCSFTLTVRHRQVFNLSFLLTQTDRPDSTGLHGNTDSSPQEITSITDDTYHRNFLNVEAGVLFYVVVEMGFKTVADRLFCH